MRLSKGFKLSHAAADRHNKVSRQPTGKRKWAYHTGGKPTAGPTAADGFVYVCDGAGSQQLHAKTGKPRWTYTAPSGAAFSATPAVASGLVLAGCADGSLYAVRA